MSNKRNELILIVLLCIVVAIFVTSTFYEDFFIIPTVYEESRDEDGKATFSFRFRFKSEPVEEVAPDRYHNSPFRRNERYAIIVFRVI